METTRHSVDFIVMLSFSSLHDMSSFLIQSGKLYLHAGAGIVADSDPESEYQETLHKASGFFQAAASF